MPTPKQVRFHYKKISKLTDKLIAALWKAQELGVINCDREDLKDRVPTQSAYEMWQRIIEATEKQLAKAMREEIEKSK